MALSLVSLISLLSLWSPIGEPLSGSLLVSGLLVSGLWSPGLWSPGLLVSGLLVSLWSLWSLWSFYREPESHFFNWMSRDQESHSPALSGLWSLSNLIKESTMKIINNLLVTIWKISHAIRHYIDYHYIFIPLHKILKVTPALSGSGSLHNPLSTRGKLRLYTEEEVKLIAKLRKRIVITLIIKVALLVSGLLVSLVSLI